jgi:hypothetical protein
MKVAPKSAAAVDLNFSKKSEQRLVPLVSINDPSRDTQEGATKRAMY